MDRQIVGLVPDLRKNSAIPGHVVVTHRDETKRGIDAAHGIVILVEVVRVGSGVGMSAHPASPYFVSDLPIFHAKRLWVPVRRAHGAILRCRRPIAVLNPGSCLFWRRTTSGDVHRNRWLRAHSPSELDEFIRAEVARLRLVCPGEIDPRWTLVARTDAPRPMVILRNVSAGPADESGMQPTNLLEYIATHSANSGLGNERNLVEPDPSSSGKEDRESRQRVRPCGSEQEIVSPPIPGNATDCAFRVRPRRVDVGLERHNHRAGVTGRLHPRIPVIRRPGLD